MKNKELVFVNGQYVSKYSEETDYCYLEYSGHYNYPFEYQKNIYNPKIGNKTFKYRVSKDQFNAWVKLNRKNEYFPNCAKNSNMIGNKEYKGFSFIGYEVEIHSVTGIWLSKYTGEVLLTNKC